MSDRLRPLVRRRYDLIYRFYDLIEGSMEIFVGKQWRTQLNNLVTGPKALEVGVGTGRNIPYYQDEVRYTALDLSPKMLSRAVDRARRLGRDVEFAVMDVENLGFGNHVFDTAIASFTFCSVMNPVKGLQEIRRVCKPGARLLMIEHVRPKRPLLAAFFDLINPLMLWTIADNINRDTLSHIRKAGWEISFQRPLSSDLIWLIEAYSKEK